MEEAFKKRLKGFLRQSSLQTFLQLLTCLLNLPSKLALPIYLDQKGIDKGDVISRP